MDVNHVLQDIQERRLKTTELIDVDRNLIFDIGQLTAWDPEPIVLPKAGLDREVYFRDLARDNVQFLLNKLYSMEHEVVDGERVIKLPEPINALPREKPVPKPKEPTKWEKFAKEKGIKSKSSKRREKNTWDDTTQKWVPRYGYNKVKSDDQKDWLIEIPDNADPNVDYFAKRSDDKRERIAKNKFQQLRNIARTRK